jgi:hypothetical protein
MHETHNPQIWKNWDNTRVAEKVMPHIFFLIPE